MGAKERKGACCKEMGINRQTTALMGGIMVYDHSCANEY
jgi:hypothetical protein